MSYSEGVLDLYDKGSGVFFVITLIKWHFCLICLTPLIALFIFWWTLILASWPQNSESNPPKNNRKKKLHMSEGLRQEMRK